MHIDERHHDFRRVFASRILVAKRERGLVAMMTIGDEQFLIGHQSPDSGDASWIGDTPESMLGAILVGYGGVGRPFRDLVEHAIDLALRIGIEHEELLKMSARMTQQFQAILLRT